jgi:hypothetical protein
VAARDKIWIKFERRDRGEPNEQARQTVPFDDCSDGRFWEDVGYNELIECVRRRIMPSLELRHVDVKDVVLFTVADPDKAPVYLLGQGDWRCVLRDWQRHSITRPTIFVETPGSSLALHQALQRIDLAQLQRGFSRRRTGPAMVSVLRQLNNDLADESSRASDVVPQTLRISEITYWMEFCNFVRDVFGTTQCQPHPGIWYCWCGWIGDEKLCTKTILPSGLGDFTSFLAHLKCCQWPGARVMARRLFEYLHFNRTITTPLPPNMPIINVNPRLIYDCQPNVLANGSIPSPLYTSAD